MKKLWSLLLVLLLTGLSYADITPLPDPPSRTSPSTFAAKADAFLGALPAFATEANQLATDVNADEVSAAASAAAALGYSNIALSSANFAGDWEDQAGAAAPPYAVWHAGNYWQLVNTVLDVSATEPGQTADWRVIGDKITVSTIADLRLISGVSTSSAYLIGHTSANDGGHGVFYWDSDSVLSDNGGTIIAVTGVTTGRWIRQLNGFVTPEMFGLVTDNSTAIQAAWEYCEANGTKLVFQEKTYTCGTALDFRISSLKLHNVIDGNGAVLDFSGSGIGSGDLVQIGADSQASVNENTKFIVSGLRVKGPNIGTPGTADVPTTTVTGIRLQYALGLSISDTAVTQCYMGYEAGFCFPVVGTNVSADGCYIGLYLLDDMTDGVWNGCQFKEGRFGIVAAPTSTAVYGQTFINCDLEGNKVGCALDPGTHMINDITFIQPYLESIVYDGFRINRSVNLADASDDGADRAANLYNLTIKGGVWNGAWGAPATHQPIRFHDADSAAAPAGCIITIPVDLSTCSVGYTRKSSIGNNIDISVGAGTSVELPVNQISSTWTPAITFDGNAVGVTYGSRYGRFVKTGNMVSFTGRLTLTSKGSSTGVFRITGLPFTSQATVPGFCQLTSVNDIASTTLPSAVVEASSTTITLLEYASGTGDATAMQDTSFTNTSTLYFGGHYYITY